MSILFFTIVKRRRIDTDSRLVRKRSADSADLNLEAMKSEKTDRINKMNKIGSSEHSENSVHSVENNSGAARFLIEDGDCAVVSGLCVVV